MREGVCAGCGARMHRNCLRGRCWRLQGLGDEEELEVSEVRKIWRGQYSKVKASQEAIYVN